MTGRPTDLSRIPEPLRDVMLPPEVAAVSMAVLCGARSYREVAKAIGYSLGRTHDFLVAARALGLIILDDGKDGSLRPGLGVVASSFGR